MRRLVPLTILTLALLAGLVPAGAGAHAVLVEANPAPGASLERSPASVRLRFSEQTEPSVSEIRVLDPDGRAFQKGRAAPADADGSTLSVPVGELAKGAYTVDWRIVSADDGHATSGTYRFGVQAETPPSATSTSTPSTSAFEAVARFYFLAGLVLLLGAAAAAAGRFGGPRDQRLAAGGWLVSMAGLMLLALAQKDTAQTSFSNYFDTASGHAMIWRALALGAAGIALLISWRRAGRRGLALPAAGLAGLVALAFHVGAGHAASGGWSSTLTIAAQTVHAGAIGVWLGGLAALVLGLRGAEPDTRSASLRRFGLLAATAFVVVLATGVLRAVDELSSFGQLTSTGYGRAVLAKILLLGGIAVLALRNRSLARRPAANVAAFSRGAGAELVLAVAAIAVAALLGTLAPPAPAGPASGARGLTAAGSDPSGTVDAELIASAERPGANRFTLDLSGLEDPAPERVALRFDPIDDPAVKSSSLTLRRVGDSYVGRGSNLEFDGRWGIDVLVGSGGGVVDVPLELDVPGPKYFVSVERIPGEAPKYTMQIGGIGSVRIEPDPERAGPSRIVATCFTNFGGVSRVDTLVLTLATDGEPEQVPVRRIDKGRFAGQVDLFPGPLTVTVVAYTRDGTRLRAEFRIDIPDG